MLIFCSYTQRSFDQKVSNDLISCMVPYPVKLIPCDFDFFVFNKELFSSDNLNPTLVEKSRPEMDS